MSGYTKLFASIVHSTIWRESNHVRLVWITMLALADRDGIVSASIPGLADASRVTLSECEEAIEKLMSPDRYSRSKEHEGRRILEIDGGWRLVNHGKYTDLLSSDDRLEKAKNRQAAYRERRKKLLGDSGDVTRNAALCDVTEVTTLSASASASSLRSDKGRGTGEVGPKKTEEPSALASATPDSQASMKTQGVANSGAGTGISVRPANSLSEALAQPIAKRCEDMLHDPMRAQFVEPHKWPEVVSVANSLAGRVARLGQYHRDTGVRAVVELYAAGYSEAELLKCAKTLPNTEWWKAGPTKGLSSLTPEVIRRHLDSLTPEKPKRNADTPEQLEALRARVRAEHKERYAQGAAERARVSATLKPNVETRIIDEIGPVSEGLLAKIESITRGMTGAA